MKNPFARTVVRAFSLCLLAGFAGSGTSQSHAVAIAPGADIRTVTDEMLADAMAARPKTQAVVCGSSNQITLGVITRRRGRFRCVA